MSGTGGAAPPTAVIGLDLGGSWHRGAIQRSGALAQTYLLTSSVRPPPSAARTRTRTRTRTGAPLRLPSLVAAPRRRSMTRLSFSEPSLLTPGENVLSEGFSGTCRSSVLQKRPPPPSSLTKSSTLLPRHAGRPSEQQKNQQLQSCSRPAYIHFSQAIQPGLRPQPVRRHSHNPALSSEMLRKDLRPSAARRRYSSSQGEPLSVVGKPCPLSCSQRPAAPPARAQLHVFLPSEAEAQEADCESVDEGFMDELDSRMSSMKLQQGAKQP